MDAKDFEINATIKHHVVEKETQWNLTVFDVPLLYGLCPADQEHIWHLHVHIHNYMHFYVKYEGHVSLLWGQDDKKTW